MHQNTKLQLKLIVQSDGTANISEPHSSFVVLLSTSLCAGRKKSLQHQHSHLNGVLISSCDSQYSAARLARQVSKSSQVKVMTLTFFLMSQKPQNIQMNFQLSLNFLWFLTLLRALFSISRGILLEKISTRLLKKF